MARGEANQPKIHYKGKDEDFVVFVDDIKDAQKWKTDKTIRAQPWSPFIAGNEKRAAAQ